MDSAYTLSIDSDQPKYAAQANPDRHFSTSVDFLFQESLLFTSIPMRRNVSAWISMLGLRRLICVDTLRRVHNGGFFRGTAHITKVRKLVVFTISFVSNCFLEIIYLLKTA